MGAASTAAQRQGAIDVAGILARVGEQVEQYFARAESVVCTETVRLAPLRYDLTFDTNTHQRQLVYEARVGWDAPIDADAPPDFKVLRETISVDGRKPREKDENSCLDPTPISPEPLTMLLPGRQQKYQFTFGGLGKMDDRPAVMLDYRSRETGKVAVTQLEGRPKHCFSVDTPGHSRGRIWIDQATGEVLRLDERLTGMVDFDVPPENPRRGVSTAMTLERADSSTRYKRVRFSDPDETLLLPASVESVTVIRNSGVPRLRTTQMFTNYRRFVTGGRIVQ